MREDQAAVGSRLTGAIIALALFTHTSAQAQGRDITMTPAMQRDVTRLIQDFGFSCPIAKTARSYGQYPRGALTRVWCGPPGIDGLNANLVYEVTLGERNSFVRPWQGDPHKAPPR